MNKSTKPAFAQDGRGTRTMRNPVRVHLWLEQDDVDFYKAHFSPNPGFSTAIRTVLHAWRVKMEEKAGTRPQASGEREQIDVFG